MPNRRRRRFGFLKFVAVALGVATVGLALLPWLLSQRSVREMALARLRDGGVDFSCSEGRLRWLGPNEFFDVRYQSPDGRLTVHADVLRTGNGLLKLLPPVVALGTVTVAGVDMAVTMPPPTAAAPSGGPAAEAAGALGAVVLAPAPAGTGAPGEAAAPPAVFGRRIQASGELALRDGRVVVQQPDGRRLELQELAVDVAFASLDDDLPLKLVASVVDGPSRGRLQVNGYIRPLPAGVPDPAQMRMSLGVQVRDFPCHILSTAAAVTNQVRVLDGRADLELGLNMNGLNRIEVELDGRVDQLRLVGGPIRDDATVASGTVKLALRREGERLHVERGTLKLPFLEASATGSCGLGDSPLTSAAADVTLDMDLADLARTFPRTLGLRDGLTVRSGALNVVAHMAGSNDTVFAGGTLALRDLAGTLDGRAVALSAPLTADVEARVPAKGLPELDHARVFSGFANITGSGNREAFALRANVDLAKLTAELGRFVELKKRSASGTLDMRLLGQAGAQGGQTLDLLLVGKELAVAGVTPGTVALRALTVDGKGVLAHGQNGMWSFVTGDDGLSLVSEVLNATFAGRVENDGGSVRVSGGTVSAGLQLAPAAELLRLAGVLTNALQAAGEVSLTTRGGGGPGRIAVDAADVAGKAVKITAPSLTIDEPSPQLSFAGMIRPEHMALSNVNVRSRILDLASVRLERTGLAGKQSISAEGRLAVDMARVGEYLTQVAGRPFQITGRQLQPFRLTCAVPARATPAAILAGADGEASLQIESLSAYGMTLGTARPRLTLQPGVAVLALKAPLNDGTLDLLADVRAVRDTLVLTMPTNHVLLSGVKITDAMAAELLGQINPIIAGCSVVSGRVDLVLDRLAVPLTADAARHATVEGRFLLRGMELTPAGLAAGALELGRQQVKTFTVDAQTVGFRCANGRIETTPLQFRAKGNPFSVGGSIGVDKSLDFTLKVPLTEALIGRPELMRFLPVDNFTLPIGGTIDHPRIKSEALGEILNDLLAQTIRKFSADQAGQLLQKDPEQAIRQGADLLKELLKKP